MRTDAEWEKVRINSDPVNLKCRRIAQGGVRFLNREVGHFSEIGTNRELGTRPDLTALSD